MTCETILTLMQLSVDRELAEDEQSVLDAHLASCPECAALYGRLLRLSHDLEQLPKVVPPISIVDSILPKLEQLDVPAGGEGVRRKPATSGGFRSFLPSWRLAGSLTAAAVVLGIVLFQLTLPQHTANDMATNAEKASAPQAQAGSGAAPAAKSKEPSSDTRQEITYNSAMTDMSNNSTPAAVSSTSVTGTAAASAATPTPAAIETPDRKIEVTFSSSVTPSPEDATAAKPEREPPADSPSAETPPLAGADSFDVMRSTEQSAKGAGGANDKSAKRDGTPTPLPAPAPHPGAEGGGNMMMAAPAYLPPPQELVSMDGTYIARIDPQRRIVIVSAASGEEKLRSAVWAGGEFAEMLGWEGDLLSYRIVAQDGASRTRMLDLRQLTDRAASGP
ncbi:zf-HC2 domain-containing protein [Paenibacillus cymbidii]|uniref:zf-HC2 domain-containing protein n=1 Tax=Paenibacillus cymbidii TaxID=1639034 RepID=UPI0010822242|nr:zf-HC2 domain-containing protein [Paenibacillus cymbidii]